ncbi:hypothetical protein [Kineosporia sp. A_224]|uniref:hypothetical protein n=1 Tax=Kineosporia sp. A_224 TaxID=1962180 RepID=UPI000B4B0756|nr:hypothetical protein [Kineosporia sp. A_224]
MTRTAGPPTPLRRAVLALLALGLVLAGTWAVRVRVADGLWPWQEVAERVTWCDRDYVRLPGPPRTLAAARSEYGQGGLQQVTTAGRGARAREVWADPGPGHAVRTPDGWRPAMETGPCAMGVYVRTGPDAFVPFEILGGP